MEFLLPDMPSVTSAQNGISSPKRRDVDDCSAATGTLLRGTSLPNFANGSSSCFASTLSVSNSLPSCYFSQVIDTSGTDTPNGGVESAQMAAVQNHQPLDSNPILSHLADNCTLRYDTQFSSTSESEVLSVKPCQSNDNIIIPSFKKHLATSKCYLEKENALVETNKALCIEADSLKRYPSSTAPRSPSSEHHSESMCTPCISYAELLELHCSNHVPRQCKEGDKVFDKCHDVSSLILFNADHRAPLPTDAVEVKSGLPTKALSSRHIGGGNFPTPSSPSKFPFCATPRTPRHDSHSCPVHCKHSSSGSVPCSSSTRRGHKCYSLNKAYVDESDTKPPLGLWERNAANCKCHDLSCKMVFSSKPPNPKIEATPALNESSHTNYCVLCKGKLLSLRPAIYTSRSAEPLECQPTMQLRKAICTPDFKESPPSSEHHFGCNPLETIDLRSLVAAQVALPPTASFSCAVQQGASVPNIGASEHLLPNIKSQDTFSELAEPYLCSSPSSDASPMEMLLPTQLTAIDMHDLTVCITVQASSNFSYPDEPSTQEDKDTTPKSRIYIDTDLEIQPRKHGRCFQVVEKALRGSFDVIESLCGIPVPYRKHTRTQTILRGLQGTFLPGRLVAILGPSGSGKSTLLNVLAGRLEHTKGQLKINGLETTDPQELRRFSAFIQQLDLFLPNLTVEEHLSIQIQLRLDKKMTAARRKELVKHVMTRFGLYKVRDVPIGSTDLSYGISGGERKRLSVASATLTNPYILLADEPTTGLDSVMAISVVAALRRLAASGRTVIASLHQPSTSIFAMCDEVLLLAEGRIVYFGDRLGSVEWMRRLGMVCPKFANPSDFLIRCVSLPENPQQRAEKLNLIYKWADTWEAKGDEFLREWTESGRLAFFQSSRSFAERSIEMGLCSGTGRPSLVVSPEPSVWNSSQDGVFDENADGDDNVGLPLSMESSWAYSNTARLLNLKCGNPVESCLSVGSSKDVTSLPRLVGGTGTSLRRKSYIQRSFAPTPQEENNKQSGSQLSRNDGDSRDDRTVYRDAISQPGGGSQTSAGIETFVSEATMLSCFDTFYSAPAATSLSYLLSSQNDLEDTRKQLTAETTKALLRTFRYSGPRPYGRCSTAEERTDGRLYLYVSPLDMGRPRTAIPERRCRSVVGKPVSLRCYNKANIPSLRSKADESCAVGIPEKRPCAAFGKKGLRDLQSTEPSVSKTTNEVHEKPTGQWNGFSPQLDRPSQPLQDEETVLAEHVYLPRETDLSKPETGEGNSTLPVGSEIPLEYQYLQRVKSCKEPDRSASSNADDLGPNALAVTLRSDGELLTQHKRHGFWYQLRVLTNRALTSNRRDPILLYARALQTLVIAVMYGSMFLNLGDTFSDAKSKVSALFFVLTNQGLVGAAGVCSTFPTEKVVISRERESGFVDTRAYILAKMLADIPIQCIFPILFNVITMLMMNLCNGWESMVLSCVVALAVCNSAITVGYLGSAAAASSDVALIVAQIWVLPALLFSGFIIKFDDIPKPISWLQYLSYFRYGFIAYAQLIFGGLKIPYELAAEGYLTGEAFMKAYLGITVGGTSNFWTQIGYLALMIFVFRAATVIIVVPLAKNWREKPS